MPLRPGFTLSLRHLLILLTASGLLPLALLGAWSLHAAGEAQRREQERALLDQARALSSVVDAELDATVATLSSMARAPALAAGDLRAFHEIARARQRGRPGQLGAGAGPEAPGGGQRRDREGRPVAHAGAGGGPALPVRQAAGEQVTTLRTADGDPIVTAWTRLSHYGWTVAISKPRASPVSSLAAYGAAIVVSFALCVAATLLARRIAARFEGLQAQSAALGAVSGEQAAPVGSRVQELRELGQSLESAAAQQARHEAERARLLASLEQALDSQREASRAKDEFLAVLGHELAGWGHDLRVAHTGGAALAAFEDFAADIAILDIGLPDMDGYALAGALRAHGTPALRLVALTGYGQQADLARAARAGFDLHLTKPAALIDLRRAVEQDLPAAAQ